MSCNFEDIEGRKWTIQITAHGIRQVMAATEIHLGLLHNDRLRPLFTLTDDTLKLVEVVFVLCEEQAAKYGIDFVQFCKGLGGDALEQMTAAFHEAYSFFCPSAMRQVLLAVTKKGMQMSDEAVKKLLVKIEELSPDELSTFTTSASNSPGSAVSNPGDSVSAN